MKLGTRSLLFGLHQFLLHPLLVLVSFFIVHRRHPSLAETVAILVHDLGYFGAEGIDCRGGEDHPYLGARICRFFFGRKGYDLVIGHNDDTAKAEDIPLSSLYAADKFFYVLVPVWLHSLLGRLSGEYMEIEESPDREWNPAKYKECMKRRFLVGEISVAGNRTPALCRDRT
jgi:hypothetical protein